MSQNHLKLNSYVQQTPSIQVRDRGFLFAREHLPWIVTGIALATITIGAFHLYRQWKLLQPVDCNFGESPEATQQAFNYYKDEAERTGNPAHQYCLAIMYRRGIGASQSLDKARDLFELAAQQGLLVAQQVLCHSCALFRNANITPAKYEVLSALAESCQEGALCMPCDGPRAYRNPNYVCFEECLLDRFLPGCDKRFPILEKA